MVDLYSHKRLVLRLLLDGINDELKDFSIIFERSRLTLISTYDVLCERSSQGFLLQQPLLVKGAHIPKKCLKLVPLWSTLRDKL